MCLRLGCNVMYVSIIYYYACLGPCVRSLCVRVKHPGTSSIGFKTPDPAR